MITARHLREQRTTFTTSAYRKDDLQVRMPRFQLHQSVDASPNSIHLNLRVCVFVTKLRKQSVTFTKGPVPFETNGKSSLVVGPRVAVSREL